MLYSAKGANFFKANYFMMKKKLQLLIFLSILPGCFSFIEKNIKSPIVISKADAETILIDYMNTKNIFWGEPISTKISSGKYVFSYFTPDRELALIGERAIMIDVITGEVTLPERY